jgi:hypothetical protein
LQFRARGVEVERCGPSTLAYLPRSGVNYEDLPVALREAMMSRYREAVKLIIKEEKQAEREFNERNPRLVAEWKRARRNALAAALGRR